MGLTCDLSPGAYLALYRELQGHEHSDLVEQRLEDIGGPSLFELTRIYQEFWNYSLSISVESAFDPLPAEHGAVASWLMAPLRAYGPSIQFGNDVQARAATLAGEVLDGANLPAPFKISVTGWVVGQVVGNVDRSAPCVPSVDIDDEDLKLAYAGLLEHTECVLKGKWGETIGSAVIWRFGGLAQALRPLTEGQVDNLGSSLALLVRENESELPPSLRPYFQAERREHLVSCRNSFTHVRKRDGFSFADAHPHALDDGYIYPLVRAASHFVCARLGVQLEADEAHQSWSSRLQTVLGEIDWVLQYVDENTNEQQG